MDQVRASVDDRFAVDPVQGFDHSGTGNSPARGTAEKVEEAFERLKSRPTLRKDLLVDYCHTENAAAFLESAVRQNFRTGCQSHKTISGSCNLLEWNCNETLEDFVNRVYKPAPESISSQSINITDVRAKVLAKHARIEVQPTDKLSDHLYLYLGRGFKILYVFSDRSFLEDSLNNLSFLGPITNCSTVEALSHGCLPPILLGETLRTLDLLFPPVNDSGSHKFLQSWVHRHELDERLLSPCLGGFGLVYEKTLPRRLRELYQQFPFWAPQLSQLLEDVNDPTPVTRWERYAKRKRSQAHMYKCAVAALMVAAVSGMLATILAVVQVWIA